MCVYPGTMTTQRVLPQSKETLLQNYNKRLKDDIRSIMDNFTEIIKTAKVTDILSPPSLCIFVFLLQSELVTTHFVPCYSHLNIIMWQRRPAEVQSEHQRAPVLCVKVQC